MKNILDVHKRSLMKFLELDSLEGDNDGWKLITSDEYESGTMIETEIHDSGAHIYTMYTQHLRREKRFISWIVEED